MTAKNIIVLVGSGSIDVAIARRVGAGKHILLSDLNQANNEAAAKTLSEAGFDVSTTMVDISSRQSVHALVEAATRYFGFAQNGKKHLAKTKSGTNESRIFI